MEKRTQIDHQLLLAQAGWVRGLAGSLVRDPLGAEDVAQETMLAALAAPALRANDEPTLRAWLARVVTNLARLAARGNSRRRSREEVAARPERIDSTMETVERAARLRSVVDAVLELDEPYRSTVLLRFFEGLDSAEIGRRTGASSVAVRKRLSRGLERLRHRLDAECDGDRAVWRAALLPLAVDLDGSQLATTAWAGSTAGSGAAGFKAAIVILAALTLSGLSTLIPRPTARVHAAAPNADANDFMLPVAAPGERRTAAAHQRAAGDSPGDPKGLRNQPFRGHFLPELPPDEPATELAQVRFEGRVLGMRGFGLGRASVEAGSARAVAGLDGSFGWEAADVAGLDGVPVAVSNADLAGVRTTAIDLEHPERELLLIAAPAVSVAGVVTAGPTRAPVVGAEVRLEAADEAFLDLWLPVDLTQGVAYATAAGEDGRYAFAALPSAPGLYLVASAEGFADLRVPVPEWSHGGLELNLAPAQPDLMWLEGFVQYPGGAPAAGARVFAGPRETVADARGFYRLPIDPRRRPKTIVADAEGWQPAEDSLGGTDPADSGLGDVPNDPPEVAGHNLMLAGKLLSIPGVAFGPEGPAAGWTVIAIDDGKDPRRPERPAGGVAGRTVADAEGRFVLTGLLDRDYRVLALDPSGDRLAGPSTVPAGRPAALRPERGVLPPQQGRIETPFGVGIAGASVTPVLADEGGYVPVGPTLATGPTGSFSLPGGASAVALVMVDRGGSSKGDPAPVGRIGVPRDAWFVYIGGPYDPAPDALEAIDPRGNALSLTVPTGPTERLRLSRGRSPSVRVAETAETLVLYHRGVEVDRLPMRLVAGEVTIIRGWTPGGIHRGDARAKRLRSGNLDDLDSGNAAELPVDGGKNSGDQVTVSGPRQP